MPIAARVSGNRNFFFGKLGTFFLFRPISIVSKKMSLESGLEQSIQAVDIMAIARDLDYKGNKSFRGEDQMLANAVIPAFQRGTVSFSGESSDSLFFACSNGATDIDGMGVNNEKGGLSSPSMPEKVFDRRSMSGVRMARRSAQLGRLRRRGNNCRMVGFVSSQR